MQPENPGPVGRATILLVEDREEDVFFLRRAFARVEANVNIRVVSNGAEAQLYMNGLPPFADRNYYPAPNIIVCDFKMPRRGGVDFLRWLRAQKDFESLPFILLSGSALPHEKDLALDLGADLYLRKTADFAQMIEHARTILEFLQRRRLPVSESQSGQRNSPARNRLILVIDDEPSVRRMVADVLESFGFEVMPAETAAEGFACAAAHRPDLILCDIVLPDALGFHTAKTFNELPATRGVPVILVTGYAYMRDFVPDSKWRLLLKPLSSQAVIEAVTHALATTKQAA